MYRHTVAPMAGGPMSVKQVKGSQRWEDSGWRELGSTYAMDYGTNFNQLGTRQMVGTSGGFNIKICRKMTS